MSNKSGTASQVITLPSGGGALQGIGETFAPDLFTGTGNCTVPLGLPPGRNGFQPKLSLVYSTGGGNGPFGLGWALSVPGVSRKTSKGVPRYRDHTDDPRQRDTFVLSGAEDLVPVAAPEPGVTRFRPRTEGLFARIERVQTAGDDFWRVRSTDGLVSLYGAPLPEGDPAVVADPAARAKIFCWKLAQTTDPFGNRIVYQYLRDLGAEGPHVWDQLYLHKVQYVDYEQDGQTRFLVSVTFVYDARPDPFSEYRAGFEMRTRLRCKRIEIRTHTDQDRLARAVELVYLDERVPADDPSLPRNGVSLLSQVRVVGHDGDLTEELPPLEFGYTRFAPERQRFQPLQAVNNALPPRSLADDDFEMVGLFGNGLPDLVQMNGAVQFWRNLGNGLFDIPRTMNEVPAGVHLRDPGVQFADMNGDGRADLLVLPQRGYFPLSFQGRWSPQGFVQYAQAPSVTFGDDDIRLMDLDGDGVVDALRTGVSFELYFNDPLKGWEPPVETPRQPLESFPNLQFSDPRVKLADLTGDNLQDFVLVEPGTIYYWPYLGHGQWGRRIATHFQTHGVLLPGSTFDPRYVLFGDVDGDGLDDLIYVQSGRLTFWINQSGEHWSDPVTINHTPPLPDVDAVRLADMLGTGMAGVLWTFDQMPGTGSNFRFLDLTGGLKPYLLEQMDNHMGAVTRVQYASSTTFYLADFEKPSTRWMTPLPFPVQVVERMEVIDELSKGKLTTEYHYHHGYWDGAEREFRGFGMVEQFDTETFAHFNSPGLHGAMIGFNQIEAGQFSPPTLTKRWFHLGPVGDESGERQEADFSSEYWDEDPPVLERPADMVHMLHNLSPRHRADAFRALRGSLLRTELYAVDGTPHQDRRPYTVTETLFGIREEARPEEPFSDRPRIFFPHPLAQRTTQWERGHEPMTQFSFTEDYDECGQPRRQTQIACPRGWRGMEDTPGQPYLATRTQTVFARATDPAICIADRVAKTTAFEIKNDGSQRILDVKDVTDDSSVVNIIGQTLNFYDGEAFVGLPNGEVGLHGALVRSERLVLTDEILRAVYKSDNAAVAPEIPPYLEPHGPPSWTPEYPQAFRTHMAGLPQLAGYTFHAGDDEHGRGYFAITTQHQYDFQDAAIPTDQVCGLLKTTKDPLGNATTITEYDFVLLPTRVTDPVGLETIARYDHRVLQPRLVTDANGNRTEYTFTPLGLLQAIFVRGKEPTEGDNDRPSTRFVYDFLAFANSPPDEPQPVFVRTVRHEHHDTETDVDPSERDGTIETVEYSDGFGRLLQTRTQAEEATFGDPLFGGEVLPADQAVTPGDAVGRQRMPGDLPQVVVSGWQVYDNKGRVVEKFEPFFAQGFAYRSPQGEQFGQKVTTFYDPRGRVIRMVNPDGSEQRVIFGVPGTIASPALTAPEVFDPTPWEVYTYDANDLAPLSFHPSETLPDGTPKPLTDRAPAAHHFTPASIEIDALGRTIKSVARNGPDPTTDWFPTRSTYDIRGNLLTVTDALGRTAFRYTYDLAGNPLRIDNIDAGVRRIVLDAAGNEVERRDRKGALILQAYDRLQRPVRLWARDEAESAVTLRERLIYGDNGDLNQNADEREANRMQNRLGALHEHYDEAGRLTFETYDFKGNILEKARQVIRDEQILRLFDPPPPDWRVPAFRVDWQPPEGQDGGDHTATLLEATEYRTSMTYDALNRMKTMRYPQDVDGGRKALRPHYNRAGALEQVALDGTTYVDHIAYNAKGQRSLIALGNGVMTRYAYDPRTFRPARMRTERYDKPAGTALTYHPTAPTQPLQDVAYAYDLVGNILTIVDRTPGSGAQDNPEAALITDPALTALVTAGDALVRRFAYDPLYRLTGATGRECKDIPRPRPWIDDSRCGFNSPNHGTPTQDNAPNLTAIYHEEYAYDPVGNMVSMAHRNNGFAWTRHFGMGGLTPDQWRDEWPSHLGTDEWPNPPGNRLTHVGDNAPSTTQTHSYDLNGNLTQETTSRHFEWDHSDRMKTFRTQTGTSEPSVHAHYLYDASGQRVKKLVHKQGGSFETTVYINGLFEHHRWKRNGESHGENNRLHMIDDQHRIAMTRVGALHPDDRGPTVQYHQGDHLGSSNFVVDEDGSFISREEYMPYGETSFGSFAMKRYRFTGKGRDEENGLYYHGARYYAPWLSRWISTDPSGPELGLMIGAHNPQSNRTNDLFTPEESTGRRNFLHSEHQDSSPILFLNSRQTMKEPSQSLHLYSYALNNPIILVDPTGTNPDDILELGDIEGITTTTSLTDVITELLEKIPGLGYYVEQATGLSKMADPKEDFLTRLQGGMMATAALVGRYGFFLEKGGWAVGSMTSVKTAGYLQAFSAAAAPIAAQIQVFITLGRPYAEAEAELKKSGFTEGYAIGFAAGALGMDPASVRNEFGNRGMVENRMRGVYLQAQNDGLVLGYQAGSKLSAEERSQFIEIMAANMIQSGEFRLHRVFKDKDIVLEFARAFRKAYLTPGRP